MTDLYTWLESLPLSIFIRESNSLWAFPMFLFAHALGMSSVAGGASLIDLALLGCWPSSAPVKPLERLYPAIWFGFCVNLVTGSVLPGGGAPKPLHQPRLFPQELLRLRRRVPPVGDAQKGVRRSATGRGAGVEAGEDAGVALAGM